MSRRLLREHLDQAHDGASRRVPHVERHVVRLVRLLPQAPARILDAACGPGLYAVRLARRGYEVLGVDVGDAVLSHGRSLARDAAPRSAGRAEFLRADLRAAADLRRVAAGGPFDACLLIYYVLEGFPRRDQVGVLRRLAGLLRPGGRLVAELRTRPSEHPPGRLSHWEEVPRSLLGDEPHLLLSDTTWDLRKRTYILREVALLGEGEIAVQQTTSVLSSLAQVRSMVARAGLRLVSVHDGWSRFRANGLSEELLVVAERPAAGVA
jgi:SAM-dependent methyltransferase